MMEYYSPNCTDDYNLHDLIDVDMSSDLELYQQSSDIKPASNSSLIQQMNATNNGHIDGNGHIATFTDSIKHNYLALPQKIENSWHMNQENGNPNLIVNPQTVTPIRNSNESVPGNITSRLISLPNTIQISGGNIQYVSSPTSNQQIYIASPKTPLLQQQHTDCISNSKQNVHYSSSNYVLSPAPGTPTNGSTTGSTAAADNPFPKPAYSYSCLIAMALKNSKHGSLPVAEIYNFMTRHFPYFKTAPDGWKNSVRHNLSLNKCFEKIENPNADGSNSRKGCLWALNPAKMKKMDEEIIKWNKKDPSAIKRAMAHPEILEVLEQGRELYLTGKYQLSEGQRVHHQSTGSPGSTHHISGSGNPNTPASLHQVHLNSQAIRVIGSSPMMPQPMSMGHQHITILPGGRAIHNHTELNAPDDIHKAPTGDNSDYYCQALHSGSAVSELSLDPSLSEIAIQNGIWDDLPHDFLDIPMSHSPTNFQISPRKTSPCVSPGSNGTTNLQSINTSRSAQNGTACHEFSNTSRVVPAS